MARTCQAHQNPALNYNALVIRETQIQIQCLLMMMSSTSSRWTDGGGVRALSEVIMLDRIMKRIQEKQGLAEIPKPCDYFHLIGGIGTGGIAAILFGRLRMTTTEALTGYENIASEIFSTAKRRLEFNIAFREEKVERGMKNVMKGRKDGHQMRDDKGERSTGKSFVVARRADHSLWRIRAYRHKEQQRDSMTIYGAARWTAASIENKGDRERLLSDDTKDFKNPIREVLDEATQVLDNTAKVGCVLSLGAGSRETINRYDIAKDGKKRDGEKAHIDMRRRFENVPNTYFRLDVDGMADRVEAQPSHEIPLVKRETETWLNTSGIKGYIDRLVDVLIKGTASGITVDKLTLDVISSKPRQEETAESSTTTHPVSQANSTSYPPAPNYINTDLDPNDPTYLSEQADLWAQYSDYFSALGPLASESRDLFGRILHHMTIHKHLSCALRVADEFYKRCVARDGPSAHYSTSFFYLMHLTAQTIQIADVFGAVERQEELVALCSKLSGPDHRNTRATKETLEVLKKNRDTRVITMAQARIIMKKYEDWKGKRSDAELRAEVGDERFEQKYREYVDANVANDRVPVENVCEVKGGCREKGFREVDRRMGISNDVEVERGLIEDFS
ncbi:hypothetical protein QBC32DRAFT_334844 [Pseudoneurospora amorphoporcata]|uniref:PNPLA domain-containing protein n=1 Tax=Pseudoneurospora amorphoporcata TaxID=241081 RepID=A0AAN6SIT0_9PEZI|nr:hypothetical protein QBC32DRAFT_334844 [Pseudoneurospora amorphoporcata]